MITFAFEAQALRDGQSRSRDATFLPSVSDLDCAGAKNAQKIVGAFVKSKVDLAALLLYFPTSQRCNLLDASYKKIYKIIISFFEDCLRSPNYVGKKVVCNSVRLF